MHSTFAKFDLSDNFVRQQRYYKMAYNRIFTLLAAVAVLFLAGCEKNTPEATAEKFLNAFYHMDYDKARSVSTDKSVEFVNQIEQFAIQQPDSTKQNAKLIKVNILNMDVNEEAGTAVATYTESSTPGVEQKLKMVKQNGKWVVNHTKLDYIGDEKEEEEAPAPAPVADTAATTQQ